MNQTGYIDNLMRNYPLESVTEESISNLSSKLEQHGGNSQNKPTGGFPPIYLRDKADSETRSLFNDEEKKTRQFSSHKNAVSIKDIMEQRKEATPFISLK